MAAKKKEDQTTAKAQPHLVSVTKNGLKADVTSTSLDGWLEKGWKRLDDKAGA